MFQFFCFSLSVAVGVCRFVMVVCRCNSSSRIQLSVFFIRSLLKPIRRINGFVLQVSHITIQLQHAAERGVGRNDTNTIFSGERNKKKQA